ncbi:hypothetical protein MFLO_13735 [Listeria floridensis FSL S10-1187]|uniref:Uncharacterized protein n=1 Tax=Listeria floridensis FSL S10-1187 TaxID=1265817 RepID=A0ABN0RC93_9LIST|nr:hypothetical protein MFLO_13735 [Listeria floridensis FSL S10-1187]
MDRKTNQKEVQKKRKSAQLPLILISLQNKSHCDFNYEVIAGFPYALLFFSFFFRSGTKGDFLLQQKSP